MRNFYDQVDWNKKRSLIVMACFVVFVSLVAYLFGRASGYGYSWMISGILFSGITSLSSYYWSDKLILAISGAREASRSEFFNFYTVAENLSMAARIPKPKLFVINDSAPNAFATGRDPQHAVICATTGLLDKLNRTELEGVIGHEISHIKNYDIRLMSIVSVLVGLVSLLGDWFLRGRIGSDRRDREGNDGAIFVLAFVMALLAPLTAQLIQLAISRRREFLADASSAMINKYPDGLISALKKISQDKEPLEVANQATAHLYIVNPFKGSELRNKISNLFNTHPPISERIKALQSENK